MRRAHQGSGTGEVLTRLPELIFVDCLRQYLERLPSSKTGLLGALHDSVVAHTLELIHAEAHAPWTVSTLARQVAVSRSVLAGRFSRAVGMSPMRYLAHTGVCRWQGHIEARDIARLLMLGIPLVKQRERHRGVSKADFKATENVWNATHGSQDGL